MLQLESEKNAGGIPNLYPHACGTGPGSEEFGTLFAREELLKHWS